jgi:hypothetical protein
MRSVLSLLLAIVTFPIAAQTYDFVAAGHFASCGIATPVSIPVLEWVPGALEAPTDIRTIAPLGNGELVASVDGAGTTLVILHPDRPRTPFFSGAPYTPNELVADGSGNVYVLVHTPPASLILAINADGTLRHTMTLPHRANHIELAADQCTLFYTHVGINTPGTVSRYNVCTDTPLPDFVALPQGCGAIARILPSDEVLIVRTHFSGSMLQRYSAAGTLLSQAGLPAALQPAAVALSANGTRVLISGGCEGAVYELAVNNAGVLRIVHLTLISAVDSLVSGTGFTAAIGPLGASQIPTASFAGLISLTALALLIALWRLSA